MPYVRKGGGRPGAGRKPKPPGTHTGHRIRPVFSSRTAVLITLYIDASVGELRSGGVKRALRDAFADGSRDGFDIVHAAAKDDQVQIICRADDRFALARGMQGLAIRIARNLNRELGRKGTFFTRRYDAQVLHTPAQLREARARVEGGILHR